MTIQPFYVCNLTRLNFGKFIKDHSCEHEMRQSSTGPYMYAVKCIGTLEPCFKASDLENLIRERIETNKRLNYPIDYQCPLNPAEYRIEELESLLAVLGGGVRSEILSHRPSRSERMVY